MVDNSVNPRYPKSFPPAWANMWGDNSLGLMAGYETLNGTTLRLQFIEASGNDHNGFWISGTLDGNALNQIGVGATNRVQLRLATNFECITATSYLGQFGYRTIPAEREETYVKTTGEQLTPPTCVVIPDTETIDYYSV